ncbi:izumo sperm-egg fusion protein 2 isoform X9 [Canis lupus familiaris]|uniref:izumo sperm-egg fusion protein 2 isoform X9 n=1 Tax=Canis lupus familiaris TaxID=9615 RepID=UPI000BAA0824|nr:izumo sperm-egg fusion protein 2 isoform X9 [Canis lupus familiaris]XP_038384051.1 izumo sperm-egg fusion protein 2 isoform X9 [Canis lupus familiaris]XP_038512139.1 izumo sperm-egg fusion protein 2 isoform X9 [Canis lupus familiaris]|eukprot:XP_022279151.1 izumo sperm-egg fusion protein 2 isoform X8 [Canis lupus familiaris]
MPLALALLLLLGLSAHRGRGCLQCDHSVLEALSQLRSALIPKRFHLDSLQVRAQALLLSMEGPFFRDYALNAFVGKVGIDHLDFVASFIKNQTNHLMVNSLRACDRKICHLLKEKVLDCLHCQKISPRCIPRKHCFVDRQPRMALQYEDSAYLQNQPESGVIISVFLAIIAFGVIVSSAIMYRQNRKILLQ